MRLLIDGVALIIKGFWVGIGFGIGLLVVATWFPDWMILWPRY